MRIAFVGNQDNNAYRLCTWVRQAGHDAHLYMFRQESGPRSHPRLIDPGLGRDDQNLPEWTHYYDDQRGRLSFILPSRLARQIERQFEVVVTSGATGLLAARRFRHAPVFHMSLGSEVSEFPWRLFNLRWSPAWWAAAWLTRGGLRHVQKVGMNFNLEIQSMARLGLADKVVIEGFPEDLDGNRRRVDQALLGALHEKYGRYERVFLWLSRLNFLDAAAPTYKGPEVFLEALEKIVREHSFNVRAIIGDHGMDVEAFKDLVRRKQLAAYVDYVPHLPYYQLLTYMSLANGVVFDNLVRGSGILGGVAREALSVGALLITAKDEDMFELGYGPDCPLLAADDRQSCYERMRSILEMTPPQVQALKESYDRWNRAYLDQQPHVRRFVAILKEMNYCFRINEKIVAGQPADQRRSPGGPSADQL